MGKDTHLVNIYLKIHNKQTLTMDDLRYLAQYAPECFEKTCKNVVYNNPKTKPIMEPADEGAGEPANAPTTELKLMDKEQEPKPSEQQNIEKVLDNIKRLELNDFPIVNVDVDEVKSLLGNLYMELLFPHNDKDTFFNTTGTEKSFDRRV